MNQIAGTVSFRDMNSVEKRRLWKKVNIAFWIAESREERR
jgi:hypothetical protein